MWESLILYGTLGLIFSNSYVAIIKGKEYREFTTINAQAQCEQFIKWKNLGGKCIQRR